jgi:subfamily B ATP-binding cassette protein MsbA
MENKDIVRRLLAIIKPYRSRAILSFLAMTGTAVTEPALGYSLKLLIDKGFENKVEFRRFSWAAACSPFPPPT